MNRYFLLTGVPVVAFALILMAVRPVFAEEYMAHADFSSCPRKYVPSTSADEGPFTKPQCIARVEAASRGNSMSCARYTCEAIRGGVSSGGTAGNSLQDLAAKHITEGLINGNINQFGAGVGAAAAAAMFNELFKGGQGQTTERQAAERAARAAEEANAIAKGQERERERMKELEARHQQMLGSLKGMTDTELGLKRYGSGSLELKTGSSLFGGQSNVTGILKYGEETAGIAIKMPEAPPTPPSKPVDRGQIDKLWADYLHAADEYGKADVLRQQLEEKKKVTERIRKEAEKKYQDQQRRAALIPKDSAKPEKDANLAEAENLFNQTADLDQKASQELDKANQDLKKAKLALDRNKELVEVSVDIPTP